MNITLVLILAIICLIVILFCCVKSAVKSKQEIKALKEEIANQKDKTSYLINHIEEISKIKSEEQKVNDKINGAKTDEEISDIVSAIISANNDRVQKH